ncbi:MAG: hypothetical protein O2984_03955 [Bacteroidetes bacterium]|nr:hypothetical protein [Bacteroidota bacterium]
MRKLDNILKKCLRLRGHFYFSFMKKWLSVLIFCLGLSAMGIAQKNNHGHQELRFLKEVFTAGKGIIKKNKNQQEATWEENPKAVAAALTILMQHTASISVRAPKCPFSTPSPLVADWACSQ